MTHQRGPVTSPRAPILGLTVGLVDWDRKLSRASGLCPLTDRRTARGWPAELPGGGQQNCPVVAGGTARGQLARGVTPCWWWRG